jgi:predicted nucleic acid-binding protein
VALLASPLRIPRPKAITFIQSLKTSPYVEVIYISKEIDAKAWELLTQRQDKEWSLVDCSSFIVMQDRKITESLTNDHHFEQAGFIRLLK